MQLNLRGGSVILELPERWLIKTAIAGSGQDVPSLVLRDTHGPRSIEDTQTLHN